MITAIRDVRRAKGLTLEDVARRCVPPTTAQTIGRLEMGTRTVSVAWLNRIAAALEVDPAALVTLPERPALPVAARLGPDGASALRHPETIALPAAPPGGVAIQVDGSIGDYRAGDILWCAMLAPDAFATALLHDVLAPLPAGRFAFGRLLGVEPASAYLLPPTPGAKPIAVEQPAWLARPIRLMRAL
ncbi:XRE family transcriptional regulator [Sphingomonas sp. MA1305]|uniref:helix-turn-helix domain-containing protein n=1 Tax=Sphingomonas sp. MA1305 TaxID=2479204 RepID=UPI0018E017E2|nr:helix-turn-helix transcriptional regulator [Sphingomonas sp. MA1305]MBI0476087.1 XRE family transcriptional regulator [Sphingomonas sp. MA1305]